MICGYLELVKYILVGCNVDSVMVIVGKKPDDFDPSDQPFICKHGFDFVFNDTPSPNEGAAPSPSETYPSYGLATIYTGTTRPKPRDLNYLGGLLVQLIHGNTDDDELFAKWYCEILSSNPSNLIALDSSGEIYVN